MHLTDAEYEDAYQEALSCLAEEGHSVGIPFIHGTGARYCMVDDRKLSDRQVLTLWWRDAITREILQGR